MRYIFLLLIFCCCIPVCFAAADLLPEKIAPGSAVATEAVAISDTEPSWGIIVILLMLGGFSSCLWKLLLSRVWYDRNNRDSVIAWRNNCRLHEAKHFYGEYWPLLAVFSGWFC